MTDVPSREPLSIKDPRAALELLWGEYKYRHDLSWRVVLQVTAAAAILASLPYADVTVAKALGPWVLMAPLIGVALTAFGWFMMERELSLLDLIREKYRQLQREQLGLEHESMSGFTGRVRVYLAVFLAFQLLNILAVMVVWIPRTLTLAG